MEWTPAQLVYYIDGNVVGTVNDANAIAQMGNMYMLIDHQVGGWAPDPTASDYPAYYNCDFIRVWQPQGPSNGTYRLTPMLAQGMAVDVANGSRGTRTNINPASYAGNQQWTLQQQSDGAYKIISTPNPGEVVDLNGGTASNGNNISLWDDNNGDNQRWFFQDAGNGFYRIVPKINTGKSLELPNSVTAPGSQVSIYDENGSAAQRWRVDPATAAPQTPTALAATGGIQAIFLKWKGAAGISTFNVKRGFASGGPYTPLATGVTALAYKDATAVSGITYHYVVTATTAAGESGASNDAAAAVRNGLTPVAYWRFSDGTAGKHMLPQPGFATADASGSGNSLQTYADGTAPTYVTDNPGAAQNPPAANALALNFSEAAGGGNPVRTLYTTSENINNKIFNQFTIEASVKFADFNGYQTFIGKSGSNFPNSDPALAGLYFQTPATSGTSNVPVLSIRAHQADGQFIVVNGTTALQTGKWHNVAATMDGTTLSLYMQTVPGGAYHLEGSAAFVGPMFNIDAPWTVGSGIYNSAAADPFRGSIDEARISDTALSPSQLLFVTQYASVTGRIALEGVANLAAISPKAPLGVFNVQFRAPGSLTPAYEFKNVTLTTTAGSANGTFTISSIPQGTYDIAIKGPKNLRVVLPGVTLSAATTLNAVTLLAGDTNSDNYVDATDFNTFVSAYNSDSAIPGTGYDPTADFNFDGLVDPTDFGLFVSNYNTAGAN